MNKRIQHFLRLDDLTAKELRELLERALRLKQGVEGADRPLAGRSLGMIFRKSSTRTRVSFEVGIFQLGGHGLFLSDQQLQLGRGESLADTSRVLSTYLDAIVIRTFRQGEVEEFARHASIPVINGLTDFLHPCQLLADLLTLREEFGRDLSGLTVAWIGDGNNVANSWLTAARVLGFELRIATPTGYGPDPKLQARAEKEGAVSVTTDPIEAVAGAHVVTTDTWVSMGQEGEAEARARDFAPFQVTRELMSRARSEAIFLHCLPAYRGKEVEAEVIDGPQSRVLVEAENRLHAQKALLLHLIG